MRYSYKLRKNLGFYFYQLFKSFEMSTIYFNQPNKGIVSKYLQLIISFKKDSRQILVYNKITIKLNSHKVSIVVQRQKYISKLLEIFRVEILYFNYCIKFSSFGN